LIKYYLKNLNVAGWLKRLKAAKRTVLCGWWPCLSLARMEQWHLLMATWLQMIAHPHRVPQRLKKELLYEFLVAFEGSKLMLN